MKETSPQAKLEVDRFLVRMAERGIGPAGIEKQLRNITSDQLAHLSIIAARKGKFAVRRMPNGLMWWSERTSTPSQAIIPLAPSDWGTPGVGMPVNVYGIVDPSTEVPGSCGDATCTMCNP